MPSGVFTITASEAATIGAVHRRWSCLRKIVNYTSSWVSVRNIACLVAGTFSPSTSSSRDTSRRPQNEACGNCRGRSGSLSEIVQIVTSTVRVLWPAKVTLVDGPA